MTQEEIKERIHEAKEEGIYVLGQKRRQQYEEQIPVDVLRAKRKAKACHRFHQQRKQGREKEEEKEKKGVKREQRKKKENQQNEKKKEAVL